MIWKNQVEPDPGNYGGTCSIPESAVPGYLVLMVEYSIEIYGNHSGPYSIPGSTILKYLVLMVEILLPLL